MQPVVAKRRNPKIVKENKPSSIEIGVRYFMDIENTCIPVSLLIYGNPEYRQSLGNNYFEGDLEEIFEKEDSIPLDIHYLQLALEEGRLSIDGNAKLAISKPVQKTSKIEVSVSTDIYKELEKEYCKAPKAIWYRYLDIIKRLDIKPEVKHLDWICDRAAYSPGWKFYKCKELGIPTT